MKQAGEGSFLWQDREPTDEELPLWKFWIDHDFMPRNAAIKGLLAKNTYLVVGKELPESYIRFLDHANSWEMDYKRWRKVKVKSFLVRGAHRQAGRKTLRRKFLRPSNA